ncbi:OmpA family protein [Fulvivirga sedimenti]|uniref:OmpA family protein n=1 Tax=Fulvivirga sedimenti TaxID=2879465 RepID=A0A9X1HPJ2_9BACT|nr:OmpA family protein [Fulvivirga sedimenti]MCA6073964.1 OmpA family protein [Fulvivirga sedimenti]
MKFRLIFYGIVLWSCLTPVSDLLGQKKKTKAVGQLTLNDTLSTYSDSDLFLFPNVNNIAYYENKKDLREIQNLISGEKWEAAYPLLRDYVSKFGIMNFYRETELIWRLATLTEKFGNRDEAILLYKLVLRHHREDIDIASIQLYYDSLTVNDKDYYVPLKYYYELVDFRQEVDTLQPPRSVLINMGQEINSEQSDYAPALGNGDTKLIFTSKRNANFRGVDPVEDEDLYISYKDGEYWENAVSMEGVNTRYNEGSACLSKDGKTLYFARCNSPDSYGDCDIFVSRLKEDSTWSNAENLGVNINSVAWDSHPSLSHGEDTLYFASDRIGGFGLSDIYYSVHTEDGWSRARNIGPIINSRGSDVSPFYHHVDDVLYFSSNGQNLNFGEFDIYKAYYGGVNWREPINIGPLVNGDGSEFYFTIDSRSDDLYYARSVSDRMNNLDLYSFPLPMGAQPLANTKITGSLINEENGKPFKGIVSIIDLDNGIEVAPKFLRPDGSFEFDLINNNNYLLILQGEEFFRIEELFYLNGNMEFHRTTVPISSRMEFASIEFEEGSSELSTPMFGDLDKLADFLLDNPDFLLRISGHTDSDGREDANLQLSQERADVIKEYLIYFGKIDESRISARGYGSSKPIVEEKTEEDKRLNRRVEFEIYRD